MTSTLSTTRLNDIVSDFRTISYTEKKMSYEDSVNRFLDAINSVKKRIEEKVFNLKKITAQIQTIPWFENVQIEELIIINELIVLSKDVKISLSKQYIFLNNKLKIKGIAKDEIKKFKLAIDDFTGAYENVEFVFFELPHDKEFNEITQKLANL